MRVVSPILTVIAKAQREIVIGKGASPSNALYRHRLARNYPANIRGCTKICDGKILSGYDPRLESGCAACKLLLCTARTVPILSLIIIGEVIPTIGFVVFVARIGYLRPIARIATIHIVMEGCC